MLLLDGRGRKNPSFSILLPLPSIPPPFFATPPWSSPLQPVVFGVGERVSKGPGQGVESEGSAQNQRLDLGAGLGDGVRRS